jgi:hypothetical protein
MTVWTAEELATIEAADELQIASRRRDGTLSSPRTIWVVRHGDDLYVRSVRGSMSAWFHATRVRLEGHIQAGGIRKDVTFADAGHDLDDDIDAAYRSKYRRYTASIVNSVLSPQARATTIKLVPR